MSNKIQHAGIVESITDGCMKVRIMQTSACSACKVAAHCSASEQKEKVVEVYDRASMQGRQVGEQVVVTASMQTGLKAVLLGFGFPFVILIVALVILLKLTQEEGIAALLSIACLMPYYGVIWLMRNRLKEKFSFTVNG